MTYDPAIFAVALAPMLALAADPHTLPYPLICQPKRDGVFVMICPDRGPRLRSGDAPANPHLVAALSDPALAGLAGEVWAPGGLEAAQSLVAGSDPLPPGWGFYTFDDFMRPSQPQRTRLDDLEARRRTLPPWCEIAPARLVEGPAAVAAALAEALAAGNNDGVVLRNPAQPWREGRSSAHRAELVKVKDIHETEAEIISARARKDDPGALGSLRLQLGGAVFNAPALMPRDQARALWTRRDTLPGALAVVRHLGTTRRGVPREPHVAALRRDLRPVA